ncbi:MAG TPA: glycoside hydrolase [Terriglobia bacterium]|nr:glycoside hydrolase [Terriglobia bacterium]
MSGPVSPGLYAEMRWRMIGPFRGGRTRAACGVAGQPNVFYVGQVDGGVWKSDDYGRTWRPIFDNEPSQSVGAIAVAPSDPNVVYVASGEGLRRPDLSVGDGIYKSEDAGMTWTHLGLRDGEQIPALAVDPHDPNRLFAAVLGHPYGPNPERGVYRSTDGGQTWQKVLPKDGTIGATDIEMDPSNPEVLYAGLWDSRLGPWEDGNEYEQPSGIFKSTDGGDTWQKLAGGLPPDVNQAYIAIAPSNPQRVYATVATTHGVQIFRSDDAGASWARATTDGRPAVRIGGGDLPVPKVDPKNPDVLYSTSTVTWRSEDGGKTWTGIRGAPGGDDYQNIWINPENPDIILLVSDQGAIVSVNRGQTWSSWYNQPTAQLYHVITDNQFPYRVYGGQQESGSVGISSRGNDGAITFREWHPVGVIEYGYVAPDPLHPDIVYGAGRTEVSRFDWVTGQVQNVTPITVRSAKYRAERTEPIVFSPIDPHVLYYAANVLFKTTDGGHSWQTISPDLARPQPGMPASLGEMAAKDRNAAKQRGAIYALAPSFQDLNTLWAGTDDGLIWTTHDGGRNWKDVTPPELTPWSKVTQISASHFDTNSAYASVSRFRIDDLRPYIYRTRDGGKSWQLITQGLPDGQPVDTVREDPVRKGLLFAGTESAVWVSFDDGDHWQSLQLNLPHTSMRDLWIHDDDLLVATHGRSFWILDDITPLRQITETVAGADAHLFQPEPAWRVRRDTNTDTPLPPDEPAAQNPPDGAVIDYFLGRAASGPVTLEILDAGGKLVRRYASTDKPEVTEDELRKTLSVPLYWVRMPGVLSAEAGMHRWVWDLHYTPPPSARYGYPIAAIPHDTPREPLGPSVLPGRYTVRLTANGQTYTEPLVVKMDPRVKTPPAGLEQQFNMERRLAAMLAGSYDAAAEARSLGEQLEKLSKQATGTVSDSIAGLQKKMTEVVGRPGGFFAPPSPEVTLARVGGEVGGLYGPVGGADAAPTATQAAAMAEVERDYSDVMRRWSALKTTDVPALNRQLSGASLPEIRLEAKPQPAEESEDVE